jgi:predicted transcriptional regulator
MVAACLDQTREVDVEHLQFGFGLTDYAVQSIRAVFGTRMDDEVAMSILDLLAQAPDGWLNTSTIAKALHKDGSRTKTALRRLLDAGLVVREDRSTGGRPAIGYVLKTF